MRLERRRVVKRKTLVNDEFFFDFGQKIGLPASGAEADHHHFLDRRNLARNRLLKGGFGSFRRRGSAVVDEHLGLQRKVFDEERKLEFGHGVNFEGAVLAGDQRPVSQRRGAGVRRRRRRKDLERGGFGAYHRSRLRGHGRCRRRLFWF